MSRRGFTIVELLIVIAIMGILLTLALVNLRGSQVSARDKERVTDTESIALNLDQFYQFGKDKSTNFSRYPSTSMSGASNIQIFLRDADLKSFTPPGTANADAGFLMATNNTQTTSGVLPRPTISTYVYQPLQQDGTLCTLETQWCTKYNLFYRLELDNVVYITTSRHQ